MANKTTKNTNAPPMATPGPNTETAITPAMTQPSGLQSSAPAWLAAAMGENGPRGLEVMDRADLIIARLVLAQQMSPEVVNAKENGYGIEVGDIFDNLSKEVRYKAGGPGLQVIPIILGKSRLSFGDLDKGEGILCRSDDAIKARPGGHGLDQGGQPTDVCASCVRKEFDDSEDADDRRPQCSLLYNIIVLLPEFDYIPAVWSNKHTQVKVAKRFLSTASMRRADLFAQKYMLHSQKEKSDKFVYQNFDFKPMGWVEEHEYKRGLAFYESLKGKTWAADTSDIETPADADEVAQPIPLTQEAPPQTAAATTVNIPPPTKPATKGPKEDIPF